MKLQKIDPFVSEYRAACNSLKSKNKLLRKLRGKPNAKILLIAPPPIIEELENDLPFSNNGAAKEFHQLLSADCNLSTQDDMLVMSCHPLAKKVTKKTVEPFRSLVLKHAQRFKLIIIVGGDSFKFYFGNGKKSALNTLASGTLIYMPKLLKHVPVFIFPDIQNLAPAWTGNKDIDWKLEADQKKCAKWLNMLTQKLNLVTQELRLKC